MVHSVAADQKCILALRHLVLYKPTPAFFKIYFLADRKSVQIPQKQSDVIHYSGLGEDTSSSVLNVKALLQ